MGFKILDNMFVVGWGKYGVAYERVCFCWVYCFVRSNVLGRLDPGWGMYLGERDNVRFTVLGSGLFLMEQQDVIKCVDVFDRQVI